MASPSRWRKWAAEKILGRKLTAKRSDGFAAAMSGRLAMGFFNQAESANAAIETSLSVMRNRARGLAINAEFARRYLSLVAINVVGADGPSLQVRRFDSSGRLDKALNDSVELHWFRFCKRCDITGTLDMAELLRLAAVGMARDGEALIRVVRGRRYRYGIALQILEPDRIDETLNVQRQSGNFIRMGVELDPSGTPVAYHIRTAHPGERVWQHKGALIERVPASDVYLVFRADRAEQVRGYTWFHAVMMRANMLKGYEDSAVVAARVGASKMGVLTRKSPDEPTDEPTGIADSVDQATGALQMTAEPGEFMDFTGMPGVGLESWNPDYPHQNYESFIKTAARGLASGLDVATHNLSGDMTDVNYSSARIAEMSERDSWRCAQGLLKNRLLMPFYADFLDASAARGALTFANGSLVPVRLIPDILDASQFVFRKWEWVDPLKEAQASIALIDNGLASRTEITAARGREFEDVAAELGAEQSQMAAVGLESKAGQGQNIQPGGQDGADD